MELTEGKGGSVVNGAKTVSFVMSSKIQCGEWRFTLSQRKSDSRDLNSGDFAGLP